MILRLLTVLAAAIPLSMTAEAHGQDRLFDADVLSRIPERMQQFVSDGQIAGAVTLIATPEKVVHLKAVGQADIAAGRPMRDDTIFRIASMTKPITATALMMLVERNKLRTTDKLSKHIPAFEDQAVKGGKFNREVTIYQILMHTAGLNRPSKTETEGLSLEQIADLIASRPLGFEPGSKWQYSTGLTVAGRLIEVLSGQSYEDYVTENIFKPLGMVDTTFRLSPEQAKRLAVTYQPGDEPGTLKAVEIPDPTIERTPNPSGGLYSTAADMAKFYQAVLNDRMMQPRRLLHHIYANQMIHRSSGSVTTGFTPGNRWGLGWCVVKEPQGVTRLLSRGTFGHGGAWGTQGWIDPDREMILVLMIQRAKFGNADGSDVRDAFTELAVKAHRGQETQSARFIKVHNYSSAVELKRGNARAVLCPQAGGRVLEFSVDGVNAMWLDDDEENWQPGRRTSMSAGRFDIGPELVTPPRPQTWSGEWTAEITGPYSARLISPRDDLAGVQLMREFRLASKSDNPKVPVWLECEQTIINISNEPRDFCHWGRSFSPGGGICIIPLKGQSRFPSKYAMYEDRGIINVGNNDDLIRERDGFLEILAPPRKPKLGFDTSAGWLAYLMPSGHAFVKRYATFPDRAYNEAAGLTLSVWYPEGARIELEPIGPREHLGPGESASFTENWWLLPHPYPAKGKDVDLTGLQSLVEQQTVDSND